LDGELDNLDEEARVKLIAKVEVEDKKKAMKITQHEEKIAAREQAKIEKAAEEIVKSKEKKKNPRVQELPKPAALSVVDAKS
jgi:Holliday junction resolvase-like predicted endonuclease